MKKILALMLLALFCIPTALVAAIPAPADFSYCADIQGAVRSGSLYQLHLDNGIIQKTGAGLEDLRLFSSSGTETPLVVIGNVPPHESVETYPLEITGYDNDASSATVIMRLPQKHQAIRVLELNIADRDFKKHAALSGSSDGRAWRPIAEDSIYDFSSQVNVRRTTLEFARTDVRYFRLTLTDFKPQTAAQPSIRLKYEGLDFSVNNMQKKDLRINSVLGRTLTPAERTPVYDQKSVTNLSPMLDKEGNTVIVLSAELPIDRLAMDVANPYYYRTVNIYGSNTGKEDSYQLLANQVIYRFPLSAEHHEEKNFLEQHMPKHVYYKIVIMNKNNPPLDLKGITLSWIQQNLYFIALKDNDQYSLCFGNPRIKRPDYDIANFVNENTLSQHFYEQRELSPMRSSGGPRLTLRERIGDIEKLLLKIVVILLVIGMGFWLFTLLKKKPERK